MKKHYLLMLAAAASFTFVSCDKDKDESTPTKTDLISNKNWTITAETLSAGSVSQDIFSQSPACEKDDFIKFMTDGKVTFDEGATKCDPSDPQNSTYNWNFANNESQVVITDGANKLEENISELTASKLVLTMTDKDTINGTVVNYTYTTTYEAK